MKKKNEDAGGVDEIIMMVHMMVVAGVLCAVAWPFGRKRSSLLMTTTRTYMVYHIFSQHDDYYAWPKCYRDISATEEHALTSRQAIQYSRFRLTLPLALQSSLPYLYPHPPQV
jgi:hypothetical protein